MLSKSYKNDIKKIMSKYSMFKIRYLIRLSLLSIFLRTKLLFYEAKGLCILALKKI